MLSPKQYTDMFTQLIKNNPDAMQAQRLMMTEVEFGVIYGVGYMKVKELMGDAPKKNIQGGAVQLDVVEVNRLRAEGRSDVEISKIFKVQYNEIVKQCGNRRNSGIPNAKRKLPYGVYYVPPITTNSLTPEVIWTKETPEVKDYWRDGNSEIIDQSGGPIKTLLEVKKGW